MTDPTTTPQPEDPGTEDVPARQSTTPARRFSDEEVARILRSAAEMQERSASHANPGGRGLTLDDLRQVAAEVGIDPRFVEQAADGVQGPAEAEASALVGGTYAWSVHRTVPGEVPEADRDRILRAIRGVIRQKGVVEDLYGRMEWSYDDGLGPLIVGVASRDGMTEIDISVRRTGEVGLWYGLGVPVTGIFGGAALGAGLLGLSGAAVLPVIGVVALGGVGGIRLMWSALSKVWERKVARLADAVTDAARELAVPVPEGAPDPGEADVP